MRNVANKARKNIDSKPAEPVADKYYGAFKVEKWPEDLDEFIAEAMQKWQSNLTATGQQH